VGVQTSRRVAREALSALACSGSASTSSPRTPKARPARTAGKTPWSMGSQDGHSVLRRCAIFRELPCAASAHL
jgi:hypothetical protein